MPLSMFDQALYCMRYLEVTYPGAYLAAALRGPKLSKCATKVDSLQSAVDMVASVENDQAVLSYRNRIALPDEVLLFQTGDDVDKGLLLFSLLLAASFASAQDKSKARLVVTDVSTFCCWRDQIIDLKSLVAVETTSGRKIAELTQASMTK